MSEENHLYILLTNVKDVHQWNIPPSADEEGR